LAAAGYCLLAIDPKGECTTTGTESGEVTGTKDKDYNLIWLPRRV
jgi:hypothetical protein